MLEARIGDWAATLTRRPNVKATGFNATEVWERLQAFEIGVRSTANISHINDIACEFDAQHLS